MTQGTVSFGKLFSGDGKHYLKFLLLCLKLLPPFLLVPHALQNRFGIAEMLF